MREIRPRRRRSLRFFRPLMDLSSGGAPLLDRRLLLSIAPMTAPVSHDHGHVLSRIVPHPAARTKVAHDASGRVGPNREINKLYAEFYAAFQQVETSYVESLSEQSSGTVSVSTTLTAPYLSGSASMQVADAGVFGPEGVFSSPVTATAMVGSVPVGTFTISGSSGNLLAVNTAQSSLVSLASGTNLTAQVTSSASTSAQSVFPNYITTSSEQLAVELVAYFDSLPIKLPRMYASPHMPQRAGAIQQYVYQLVAGSSAGSLERTLMAISLPQTPGGDLQIYDATVQAALNASKQQMLSGVQQIFANKLPVIPIGFSGGTSSTNSSSTTSSTGSSGSAGSTGGSGSTGTSGSTTTSSGSGISTTVVP